MAVIIRRLYAEEAQRRARQLGEILVACVEAGASVSFMPPLSVAQAERFFQQVAAAVAEGERVLLAAFDESNPDLPLGTVHLVAAMPPNQPHRGEIAKLLVHPEARGKGIGRKLMQSIEDEAVAIGKSLLVLDTARGEAGESLYRSMGWNETGIIPNFALFPDGTYCDTVIFWKEI